VVKKLFFVFFSAWAAVACGATRYWRPAVSGTDGKYNWNVDANWIDENGETGQPANGDTAVLTNAVTIWNVRSDITLDGFILRPLKSGLGLSGSCPKFAAGATGIRLETPRDLSFWLSVAAPAGYDLPLYVCEGGKLGFTENYSGSGRFLKQGPGTLTIGSKDRSSARYSWHGTVIEAGTLQAGPNDMRLTDHELVFSGNDASATLKLTSDQTLVNADFHETNDVANAEHGICADALVQLCFTGTPKRAVTAFTGRFHGGAGLVWAPDSAAHALVLSNAVSTATNRLRIVRGTVRFANGASWTGLKRVDLADAGAVLAVEAGSVVSAEAYALASGAAFDVGAGAQVAIPAGALTVAGATVPRGVYAAVGALGATAVDWVTGAGCVCVGGAVPKQSAEDYLEDGWYVFGNPDWKNGKTINYSSTTWYQKMALPDFNALYLPPDAKIRFRGGILFDYFPDGGATFDWSACEGFGLVKADAFRDRAIAVASGQFFWFMPCTAIAAGSDGTVTRTLAATTDTAARTLPNDVELNGSWSHNDSTSSYGSLYHAGRLSGTGTLTLNNYWPSYENTGAWAFEGTIVARQAANCVKIKSRSVSGTIAKVQQLGSGSTAHPLQFLFAPSASDAAPLAIAEYEMKNASGVNPDTGFRHGNALGVYGDHAVHIGSLKTDANSPANAGHVFSNTTVANNTRSVTGRGTVVVGTIPSASYFHLYDGVDFTVTNVAAATTFDFTAESNKVNSGTFTLVGTAAAGTKFLARTPQMIPAAVTGFAGETEITGTVWNVLADFTDIAACARTVGADWTYAPTGVLRVAWTAGVPAPGRYTLLAFPAGSAVSDAAKWPAELAPGRSENLALERTATELAVRVGEGADRVTYYVDDAAGDDAANGISPQTAWRTLARVNAGDIWPGDRVLFRRGGLWRGQLFPKSGTRERPVRYGAYGTGEKPILQGSCAADAEGNWEEYAEGIWRTTSTFAKDIGCVIFDHGAAWGWKVYLEENLTSAELHHYWYNRTDKRVYLCHPRNPACDYASIELALNQHIVSEGSAKHVTYEGFWVRYGAAHGFGGGGVVGITIRGCDISWIGGGVQKWDVKEDGTEVPTRFGNGAEFWDNARDCVVESNRVWEIYDAALTTQGHGDGIVESNIVYRYNVIWNSEYSFEMWTNPQAHTKPALCMDLYITNNTCVDAGVCWSHAQRPNGQNGSHLMFYSHSAPTTNFVIRNNVFAGATEWYCRSSVDNRALIALDHNLVWGGPQKSYCYFRSNGYRPYAEWTAYVTDLGWDTTSVNAEPRFVNPAVRDYRLWRNSPGVTLREDGCCVGAFAEPVDRHAAVVFR